MRSFLLRLSLLSLSFCSPIPPSSPNLSKAKAFTLLVHLTNPYLDLTPSISHATFSPVNFGAGLNIFTIIPSDPSTPPPPSMRLIQDTPLSNVTNTKFIFAPLPQFPLGIAVLGMQGDGLEHVMELDHGYRVGHEILEGSTGEIIFPRLSGPGAQGRRGGYVACVREIPFKMVVALFVFGGDVSPEGCVGIEILPICAEPSEEGQGGMEVDCFIDVDGF